jgi:fatty-acyl-CoA synthase
MTTPGVASIGALLDEVTRLHGPRTALVSGTRRVSYAELRGETRRAAAALAALGVEKGTHVGLLLPNSPEWLAFALGAFALGAVLVPLNTLSTARELGHALAHADVRVLITAASFLRHRYLEMLLELCPELGDASAGDLQSAAFPELRRVVVIGPDAVPPGALDAARCLDAGKAVGADALDAATRACTRDDRCAIFFTSGSTALPKGVVHTHDSMLASAGNIAATLGLTPDDITWGYLPFFFTGGLVAIGLATMMAGGAIVLQEVFDAAEALRVLEADGCTVLFGWPHQIQAIVKQPGFARARLRVHKGVGANAPWAASIYPPDHRAVSTYGMTESGPMSIATRWDDPMAQRQTTHGRPLPGVELRIADPETGAPCRPGEPGEILLRGRTMMQNYYKMAREACFDLDGFFHTGDRGHVDRDGLLHFVGRIKDVIKTAGVNVAAREIESVLREHPTVRDAYVVGVPHPTRGECPVAFVVADDDGEPGMLAQVLTEFCRARLATYKVPRHIFFRREDALPVAGSGKVLKERLRADAAALVRDG